MACQFGIIWLSFRATAVCIGVYVAAAQDVLFWIISNFVNIPYHILAHACLTLQQTLILHSVCCYCLCCGLAVFQEVPLAWPKYGATGQTYWSTSWCVYTVATQMLWCWWMGWSPLLHYYAVITCTFTVYQFLALSNCLCLHALSLHAYFISIYFKYQSGVETMCSSLGAVCLSTHWQHMCTW